MSCETIYAFIYRAAQRAEQLWRYLTTQHALLRTMRAMTTWFCDAYASWQKGGVENANGRLRRWLPRQIDIDQVSDEEIPDMSIANLTPESA